MGLKRMESGAIETPDTANTTLEGQERADQLAKENVEKQKLILETQANSPENPKLAEAQKGAIDGVEARKNQEREKILWNTQTALSTLKESVAKQSVANASPDQIRNATDSIAKTDLTAFQSKMRPDEVRQSANELTGAANAYKMEVEKILTTNLEPAERMKQLEGAHNAFESGLKEIRGVIEAKQSTGHEQNADASRKEAKQQESSKHDHAERLAKALAEQSNVAQSAKSEKNTTTKPGAAVEAPKQQTSPESANSSV